MTWCSVEDFKLFKISEIVRGQTNSNDDNNYNNNDYHNNDKDDNNDNIKISIGKDNNHVLFCFETQSFVG